MSKVTIPKTEYDKLERSVLRDESSDEVVADFRATGLYEEEFLQDLGQGLKRSSLGAQNDNQAPASCR